jgi:sugar diacid utilization regulator
MIGPNGTLILYLVLRALYEPCNPLAKKIVSRAMVHVQLTVWSKAHDGVILVSPNEQLLRERHTSPLLLKR